MSDFNPPFSFCQLVKECQRIEVPLIQRDFAQGREAQKDVRNDFLGALHGALSLSAGDMRLPLNLDFVYGSIELGNVPRFLPLDGQQRLTTLFLLSWYLAWRDDRLVDFKAALWDGHHSRFTYGVRPSSTEFFDELVELVPVGNPDEVPSVRSMLEDEPWFFLHWRSDPTIQAVLTMLDAIHERFRSSEGLYGRLTDEAQPAITFHLLPLEHFGLSDDLYIKMNARGKPLTTFETFKARFEELLKGLFPTSTRMIGEVELSVPVFFERRMDTQWTDFFWTHQSATFDDAAMNLIWAVIRTSLEPASPRFTADTTALGERTLEAGFTTFHDRGWLTCRFADHLMDLLEAWSADGGEFTPQLLGSSHFDEAAFFRRAIAAPSTLKYFELVQFSALTYYLTHHRGAVEKDALQEWMRVITNLASNSDIERPEDFGRSLTGLQKLVPNGNRILERLAEGEIESIGFSPQQVREEALKASLILSRPGWRKRIACAEAHGYFRGQIEFLLKFSGVLDRWLSEKSVAWSDAEDYEYQQRFSDYFDKASSVFSADGLKNFAAYRWERALLMKGDYLLDRGLNRSFLDNAEHDASWKLLLRGSFKPDPAVEKKRQYVRELLDDINLDTDVVKSLDVVLSNPLPEDLWRCAVIEHPDVMDYCRGRKVRWHQDGNIYLMRRIQMNGEHAELFTYSLYVGLLSRKHQKGELTPFSAPQYLSVTGDSYLPCAYLDWARGDESIVLRIVYIGNLYKLKLYRRGGPLPDGLSDGLLNDAGFNAEGDEAVVRVVAKADIGAALDEVVVVARQPL